MTFFRACISIVAALFVATFLFNARQEFFGPANPGWTPTDFTMRVAAIRTGSPMRDAGLRAGDIIESVDGRPLTGMADWFVARAHFRIGRTIQIGVRRGGLLFETRFVITREAWRFWQPSHFAAVCAFYAARLILLLSGLFLAFRRPLVAWMLTSISVAEGYPSAGWADSLTRLPAPLAVAICLAAAAWLLGAFAWFAFFATYPRAVLRRVWQWVLLAAPFVLLLPPLITSAMKLIYMPAALKALPLVLNLAGVAPDLFFNRPEILGFWISITVLYLIAGVVLLAFNSPRLAIPVAVLILVVVHNIFVRNWTVWFGTAVPALFSELTYVAEAVVFVAAVGCALFIAGERNPGFVPGEKEGV